MADTPLTVVCTCRAAAQHPPAPHHSFWQAWQGHDRGGRQNLATTHAPRFPARRRRLPPPLSRLHPRATPLRTTVLRRPPPVPLFCIFPQSGTSASMVVWGGGLSPRQRPPAPSHPAAPPLSPLATTPTRRVAGAEPRTAPPPRQGGAPSLHTRPFCPSRRRRRSSSPAGDDVRNASGVPEQDGGPAREGGRWRVVVGRGKWA